MKAGSGCSSIAVYIDSKGYASISIATDVHRCPAYIPSVVSRNSTRVNDGTVWLGYAAAAMVDERRRQREEQHEMSAWRGQLRWRQIRYRRTCYVTVVVEAHPLKKIPSRTVRRFGFSAMESSRRSNPQLWCRSEGGSCLLLTGVHNGTDTQARICHHSPFLDNTRFPVARSGFKRAIPDQRSVLR